MSTSFYTGETIDLRGPPGPEGPEGPQGPIGPKGEDGKDAIGGGPQDPFPWALSGFAVSPPGASEILLVHRFAESITIDVPRTVFGLSKNPTFPVRLKVNASFVYQNDGTNGHELFSMVILPDGTTQLDGPFATLPAFASRNDWIRVTFQDLEVADLGLLSFTFIGERTAVPEIPS